MTKNTEKLATECTEDGEKHRETGNRVYRRWRKTQRNWQQSVQKMAKNTEKLATEYTEDGEKHRETGNRVYRRWRKTQRNWQQSVQKMAKNTEKLATECTEDGEKQNKNTIPYVLDTTIHKQANNVNRT
jgi:uncharacterized protein YoxC